jgi:hypothetical protein
MIGKPPSLTRRTAAAMLGHSHNCQIASDSEAEEGLKIACNEADSPAAGSTHKTRIDCAIMDTAPLKNGYTFTVASTN